MTATVAERYPEWQCQGKGDIFFPSFPREFWASTSKGAETTVPGAEGQVQSRELMDFFDPPLEDLSILVLGEQTARRAAARVLACEACNPDLCIFLFNTLLDEVTGHNPECTDYFLSFLPLCPRCTTPLTEKTRVAWNNDDARSEDLLPQGRCSA